MKFTKPEIKRINQALNLAIDCEESYIQAHITGLKWKNKRLVSYTPKEHHAIVERTKRNIKAFKRIVSKIKGGIE